MGMMEWEAQQRREIVKCQNEDMIRLIATSSENTAQALRTMQQPRQQPFNIFDTRSDIQDAQDDVQHAEARLDTYELAI